MSFEIGWLAEPLVSRLLNVLFDQYGHEDRLRDKLNKLRRNVEKIRTIMELERRRQANHSDCFKEWLWQFKDAVYDADDVIDVFDFQSSPKPFWSSAPSPLPPKAKVSNFIKDSTKNIRRAARQQLNIGHCMTQLDEVLRTFDDLVLGISDVLCVMEWHGPRQQLANQITFPTRLIGAANSIPVIGLATETEAILQALKDGDSASGPANFSLVSIVGPVGAGKTLLAELAYNDPSITEHFEIRAWVRVSDNFDTKELTVKVIESAGIPRPADLHNFLSTGVIRNILTEGLHDARFLIVLDDVWEESATELENFLIPFNCGKKGSRVIVTTQLETVARKVGAKVTINLDGLQEKAYWKLFEACTFGDEDPAKRQGLEEIAQKIVRDLGGSPIAAIKMASILREEYTVEHWNKIARQKFKDFAPEIASVLERSYEHLPAHLKECFLSCALFPKNYCFERDQLLHIWLAMGFACSDGQADGYLVDDLAGRSFFKYAERKQSGKYVLHPLLHDLADCIADGEFFRFEGKIKSGDEVKLHPKARHVYVTADNLAEVAKTLRLRKKLRSLVVDGRPSSKETRDEFLGALKNVLRDLKLIRVLVLGEHPRKLDKWIRRLKHLRYLQVPEAESEMLSESHSMADHAERMEEAKRWLRIGHEGSADELASSSSTNDVAETRIS